jgi:short-subunit dehydrogenase
MRVVVVGAASRIAGRIAVALASGNDLVLVGRDSAHLLALVEECMVTGAADVQVIEADLRKEDPAPITRLTEKSIDVLINAASATARLTDSQCTLEDLRDGMLVDAISPLSLISTICLRQHDSNLTVVYLTTILASTRTPGRAIYGSLKYLQELGLRILAARHHNLRVLTVRIGARFPRDRNTPAMDILARRICNALRSGDNDLSFGFTGRLLRFLYIVHPLLGASAVLTQRLLRRSA